MLSTGQERTLYGRMRREVERLLTLRQWAAGRLPSDDHVRRALDAQYYATIATCDALVGSFSYGETKRHRAWRERCRMF